jgi:hypothetical protein
VNALPLGVIEGFTSKIMLKKIFLHGDKFRLLGEVWKVDSLFKTQFHASCEGTTGSQSIWLDIPQADKLEWIEEEKPKLTEAQVGKILLIKENYEAVEEFKSEIIRETLELIAEAVGEGGVASTRDLVESLEKKARMICQ